MPVSGLTKTLAAFLMKILPMTIASRALMASSAKQGPPVSAPNTTLLPPKGPQNRERTAQKGPSLGFWATPTQNRIMNCPTAVSYREVCAQNEVVDSAQISSSRSFSSHADALLLVQLRLLGEKGR